MEYRIELYESDWITNRLSAGCFERVLISENKSDKDCVGLQRRIEYWSETIQSLPDKQLLRDGQDLFKQSLDAYLRQNRTP